MAGVGALMALLEARRKALAAEGPVRLPRASAKSRSCRAFVGVVTSPTGAVIRDILHRLADRFPVRVVVWPVSVQGETSAAEVAAAIDGFNALAAGGAVPRPDVLIVARGGGSLEDLMSFNDEVVVRAAARSAIPLIAAVGHETDWTLHRPRGRPARADADRGGRIRRAGARRTSRDARGTPRARPRRDPALRRAPSRRPPGALPRAAGRRGDRRSAAPAPRPRGGDADRAGARRLDQRALRAAGLARRLARHSPRAHLAGQRERVRGLIGRLGPARADARRPAAPARRKPPAGRSRARGRSRPAARRAGGGCGEARSRGWRAPSPNACSDVAPSFSPPGNCSAR